MLVKRGWTVKEESPGNNRKQKVCWKDSDGESEKQRVATERPWRTVQQDETCSSSHGRS